MSQVDVDVAIIGGGLAGTLLARQLRRANPELSVALFEKSTQRSFKVGESTVEIGSHYLLRQGLSRYLYLRHLPKNGLRFFFDVESKDAELEEMSELGSLALPFIPSFQIDRARFEEDLLQMARDAGVEVRCGAKVSQLQVANDGAHRFKVATEESTFDVGCRWLVDASGRAQLLSTKLGLKEKDPHGLAAVWGRFRNVADLDSIGSLEFNQRVRHTSRVLSTNHFCYPGYWIWFIPLSSDVTSVGVVIDNNQFDDSWRSEQGFQSFLRKHGAPSRLLEDAEMIDIGSYGHLSYGSKAYFSKSRWGLVGEAAAFTDPFYSPGTDFIALENDYMCDLIVRDARGEDIAERTELYDEFMRFRYDSTMLLYRDLYRLLGSYELFSLKWDFDIACYYNLWVEPYMRDQHLDVDFLRGQLRQRKLVMSVMKNFAALFLEVQKHLDDNGNFYRKNLGEYQGTFPTMDCQVDLGTDASAPRALRRTAEAFNLVRRRALEMLGEHEIVNKRPTLPMSHFLAGKPLI